MSKLIDSHVSTKQAKLAIDALLKYNEKRQAEKEESELLGAREEVVWLNVGVKKAYPEKKLKPFSIPLARPIIDPRTTSICLITKDPQREYKDLLAAQNVKFVSRVVGVTKLKGKFKPFEARRQLMKDHGIFLVDERVVPMMPKLLGKIFFKAKKQPVPVNLQKKDVKSELERAVSSTYMHQNQGTCTAIKIAPTTFTSSQVLENLTTALPEIVKRIQGGWENVQSLHIKTSGSVSLPIWSCDLSERWDGLGPVEEADAAASGESEGEEESEEDEEPAPVVKEGKKRSAPTPPSATNANKKAKASEPAKVATKEAAPVKAKAKAKTKAAEATSVKAETKSPVAAAATAVVVPAKKAIPKTPIVEESSGSDSEPEPAPKPTIVKKPAVVSSVAQKKAKVLASKGSTKGSKARILGNKKVSSR
ncbi:ribosomal l1p/L10e family domain-containing protein [Rhizoctonia solani AG-1 IA]|uniref:Ribosomal l1p/L10e family domain-containing protein n=1 Tax=Thanatephorus cucumeris (strain AG1-IA) TaxID=983506 RepID=L8WP63_THACA|nr:ribosomal l1p/L10e family domain-containing protein [Rhizoctonia solani AG-1 IA]